MKRMLSLLLILTQNNFAAIGCMDDSFHVECVDEKYYNEIAACMDINRTEPQLQQAGKLPTDHHIYHPVWCNCPCERYRAWSWSKTKQADICPICLHRGKIDRKSTTQNAICCQKLIERYKEKSIKSKNSFKK